MSFDLMFEIVWKSVVVSALAAAIVWAMRGRSPAHRAWVAHAGLLMTLLTPLLVLRGPNFEVIVPWSAESATRSEGVVETLADPALDTLALAPTEPASALPTVTPEMVLMAVYGLVALLLVVGLGVAVSRLFLLQRRAEVLTDAAWLGALAHAQRRMGFKQGTALLVSDDLGSPVSWGFLRPTILLNPRAVATPAQAEAVIAHELAHVMRLDWANLMIARLATAVFWFNPLVWLLARQAHQYREEAADDAVLRGKVAGTDYASLLVGIARHDSRGALLAANGVAPGKDSLKRRLTRVLDAKARRTPANPAWIAASSLAALSVVAPLAALTPVARPALVAAPSPVAIATPEVGRIAAVATATPEAVEPGKPVSATAVAAAASGVTAIAVADAAQDVERSPRRSRDDLLMQMSLHGVTPEWAEALASVNPKLRGLNSEQLVGLAVHRVGPGWLSELEALGYRDLDYDQVVAFAVHRVSPDYIRALADAGYRDLPPDTLIGFRVHRVTADYVRRLDRSGLKLDPATVASGPPPTGRAGPQIGSIGPPIPPTPATPTPPPTTSHRAG